MTSRQERTRKLIQIGGLFEIVGLSDLEPGAILGLLIENKFRLEDEITYMNLKKLGDAELNRRATERKARQRAKRKESSKAA